MRMDFDDPNFRQLASMLEQQARLVEAAYPPDVLRECERIASIVQDLGLDRFQEAVTALGINHSLPDLSPFENAASTFSELANSLKSVPNYEQLTSHLDSWAELHSRFQPLDWTTVVPDLGATAGALEAIRGSLESQARLLDQLHLDSPALDASLEPADVGGHPEDLRHPEPPILPPTVDSRVSGFLTEGRRIQGMNQLTLAKLCLKQELWGEAEHHCRCAAELLDDTAEPYIGLGVTLNAQGRHDEAIEAFEDAEEFDSGCFEQRPDIRAVYEASLQGYRWRAQLEGEEPDTRES
jgi:tetratricopeptide (TPR) repeat protein